MKVKKLFLNLLKEKDMQKFADIEIKSVKLNSKQVEKGDVFVALSGEKSDGNDYIQEALDRGAKLVVSEKDLGLNNSICVQDARSTFALLCRNYYEKACKKLKIIAITGTNGKTTTTHILGSILSQLGHKVGVIGTLGAKYDGKVIDTGLTTPDPDLLHKLFYDMHKCGVEYVIMEASAHAIALKKLDGIKFDCAILTNITQDHLDFFKTMDNYANTKLSLFDKHHCTYGIVCKDDSYGRSLLEDNSINIPLVSYGINYLSDCFVSNVESDLGGSSFIVNCFDEILPAKTQLIGKFNIQNTLAALVYLTCQGFKLDEVLDKLKYVPPVEGRTNVIGLDDFSVVIDYAHTPDGLENLLKTVRPLSQGKVITLFGCGGNRDRSKRPIMGKISSRYSDHVILTSDNPRYEKPLDIIKEIEVGVRGSYEIYENRAEAIKMGLSQCQKGDTLVIAGKGAEKTQEICGHKYPFNDFDEVYKFYRQRKHIEGDDQHDS